MATRKSTSKGIVHEDLAREAHKRRLRELEALTIKDLVPINVDIASAVATTLGALPGIRAIRSEIAERLPEFDVGLFEKLEDYALILSMAQRRYVAAPVSDDLDAVLAEATTLRDTLLVDGMALAQRGLLDQERLKEATGARGYRELAGSLAALATLLKEAWPTIRGRTCIKLSELRRAREASRSIRALLAAREQTAVALVAATAMRSRAFTLLLRTYDQVRRAVIHVRWMKKDADRIAPSLYARRDRKPHKPSGRPPTPVGPLAGADQAGESHHAW